MDHSDVYGLGVLFWEIASGKSAPEDNLDPDSDFFNNPQHWEYENKVIGIPAKLEDLYKQCWSMDPTTWPDMDSIISILEEVADEVSNPEDNQERLEINYLGDIPVVESREIGEIYSMTIQTIKRNVILCRHFRTAVETFT
jgi:hypothetical protein